MKITCPACGCPFDIDAGVAEWIPLKKRLPDGESDIFVGNLNEEIYISFNAGVRRASRVREMWRSGFCEWTHWMEIPAVIRQ
jgi:hypothetical protein